MIDSPDVLHDTMLAVTARRYGGPDVLELERLPRPAIAADEVLIEVHAAGLDRGVSRILRGDPYVIRLGFGLRRPRRPAVGFDVSGVVVEVGDDVTRFRPGDEVFGIAKGSFAELAAAKEKKLAHKPVSMSHVDASVMPNSGMTALQAVRDVAAIAPGHRVAVIGASGGVGHFAVQIAKAAGAEVTGVASAAKAEFVRSLGADRVVAYDDDGLTPADGRFDVILFVAGNQTVAQLRGLLTPKGTLVVIGGEDVGRWIGLGRQIKAVLLSPFVSQRLTMFLSRETHVDVAELGEMFVRGEIRPRIGARYPLDQVARAFEDLESRTVRGKVSIEVRA